MERKERAMFGIMRDSTALFPRGLANVTRPSISIIIFLVYLSGVEQFLEKGMHYRGKTYPLSFYGRDLECFGICRNEGRRSVLGEDGIVATRTMDRITQSKLHC